MSGGGVDENRLHAMNELIEHRGPDGEGYYIEGPIGLAHRRLAILDLSEDGAQPMCTESGLVIVFNGEIYNYIELREQLQERGHKFVTGTDTEVILAAYTEWGTDCVRRFNGMWAFALYDSKHNRLFCSRDRFGVKPFYYTLIDGVLSFGSEIKQLIDAAPKANSRIIVEFLVAQVLEHKDETFFDGVKKLPPSHNLIVDIASGKLRFERYFEIARNEEVAKLSTDEAMTLLQSELKRSVEYRLRSDVTVGTCLSGGLDSSSVAAEAASQLKEGGHQHKLTAITAVSSEPEGDESEFARQVVDAAGLHWVTIQPANSEFEDSLDEVIYTQEEPFGGPSIFMQYFVMQEAKRQGCKVMLDGQGGDETLLGYEKYYPAAYYAYWQRHGFIKTVKEILQSRKNNTKMSVAWILTYVFGMFFSSLRKRLYKHKCKFIKPEFLNASDYSHLDDISRYCLDVFELQKYEIESTNLPVLLRYEDKNSMRHSIETRLPFVDFQMLQNSLNLSVEHKIKSGWTKYILRKSVEAMLPATVVWRKNKFGFAAPEKTWLEAQQQQMLDEVKASKILGNLCNREKLIESFPDLDLRLKWRVYNIAAWERLFNVSP